MAVPSLFHKSAYIPIDLPDGFDGGESPATGRARSPHIEMDDLQSMHNHQFTVNRASDFLLVPTVGSRKKAGGRFSEVRSISKPILAATVVVFIITITAFIVAIWVIGHTESARSSKFLEADIIGGHFSVTVAKLIDVVVSILIAPAILAVANYYIFRLIRVCAVNENPHRRGPLSLAALIEVSSTDWGSYSPFKHWNLLKTREPRIILVACVVVLLAMSFSFLSNVVAYQAIDYSSITEKVELDYLYSPGRDWQYSKYRLGVDYSRTLFQFSYPLMTTKQNSDFDSNFYKALSPLRDQINQTVNDHMFEQINVSDSSLNSVSDTAYTLFDIPTFRLSYECKPATIKNISMLDLGSTNVQITINLTTSSASSDIQTYIGGSQGLSEVLEGQHYRLFRSSLPQPFVAFSRTSVWLGMFSTKSSPSTSEITSMDTPFGEVQSFTHNNTQYLLDTGTSSAREAALDQDNDMRVLNFYGVTCTIMRQKGVTNLTRTSNNHAGIKDWQKSPSNYSDLELPIADTQIPMLHDLQYSYLFSSVNIPNFGQVPGLGAALTQSSTSWSGTEGENGLNFEKMADSFIYAETEARMTVYQVIQTAAHQNSSLIYEVASYGQGNQRYSITYVPWILLTGLLSLSMSGAITLGLVAFSFKTKVFRTGRIVNTLRMAMDLGVALDKETFERSQAMDTATLKQWEENCRVLYELENDVARRQNERDGHNNSGTGQTLIRLRRVPGTSSYG